MSVRYKEFEAAPSAARTVTGNSGSIDTSETLELDGNTVVFYLDVSAASGTTPTLDIDVKGLIGGVLFTLASFAQKTATGQEVLVVTNCPKVIQLNWTIGGTTPSFTFEVNGHRSR